jgi:hypothetical protein
MQSRSLLDNSARASDMSKLTTDQAFGIDTHRIWLDAFSFSPLPSLVAASRGATEGAGHPILFANSACIGMLGQDAATISSQTLEGLLSCDKNAAAALTSSLPIGCEFTMKFSDSFGSSTQESHLVSMPITDLCAGAGVVAHLIIFLQGTSVSSLNKKLGELLSDSDLAQVAASYGLSDLKTRKTVRMGLFSTTTSLNSAGGVGIGGHDAHHQALLSVYQSTAGNRCKGHRCLSSLPPALDTVAWIQLFEVCLTCAP